VAGIAFLKEKPVGSDDVAYIGIVSRRIKVADRDGCTWLPINNFGFQIRNDESRALPGPNVVERPDNHGVDPLPTVVLSLDFD
jgi:hypothetical protein